MRPLALAIATAVTLATSPLAAQDVRALAEDYVALPAIQKMMQDMFSPEVFTAQLATMLPDTEGAGAQAVSKIAQASSDWYRANTVRLNEIMVDSAVEIFTAEEMQAMIAFYSTEAGASAMAKSPLVMQDIAARMTPILWDPETGLIATLSTVLED